MKNRSTIASVALALRLSTAVLAQSNTAAGDEPYTAAIVIEPTTNTVIYEKNPDQPYPTASMIKMLTLLVVMDHIKDGSLTLDTPVTTSAHASKMGGSQVYLKQGEVFPVRDHHGALGERRGGGSGRAGRWNRRGFRGVDASESQRSRSEELRNQLPAWIARGR